jgi:pimeloyl-ACP methyl ester carboxylesterase/DNA-binding CsgD family transcriptional regulator
LNVGWREHGLALYCRRRYLEFRRSMTIPEVRYASSGKLRIAYQVVGNGPVDLVLIPGFVSNLEISWEDPGYDRLLRRLSVFARVIVFDKRGTGLSDRVDIGDHPTLDQRMDDVRAVMDSAGSGRAVLVGVSEGAAMAVAFATAYPARARALVLYGGYAHFHSAVMDRASLDEFVKAIETAWGNGATLSHFVPARTRDPRFRAWWGRLERLSASPTAAVALVRMNAQIDIRPILASVRTPTLVIHRRDDACVRLAAARDLAKKIKGARLVEHSGRDHPIWTGEIDRVADEIEEFITGTRPTPSHRRVLLTILVARLVAPERLAHRLGDGAWRERLDRFRQATSSVVARFGGEVAIAGAEELCACFDGPARAIGCAASLRAAAKAVELKLAIGVHTGEVELHTDTLSGYAVHVTERIAARADADQILVSGVVSELVSGSGLRFVERRSEPAGDTNGGLRLFTVMVEQHLEPAVRPAKTTSLGGLSSREREVLALIADGLSNAAIADRLDLSEHTVKRHVANILLKLDLPTRTAAAALVARHPVE